MPRLPEKDFRIAAAHYEANEVAPGIWVGSKPYPGEYPFDVLVLCAAEYQPAHDQFPGTEVVHAPFADSHTPTDADVTTALQAAHKVLRALKQGKRVLVTCWAGQNRSAFVAALAMKRRWRESHDKVIAQIRARRDHALHNMTFCKILEIW